MTFNKMIDAEIALVEKSVKPINVHLIKVTLGVYRGALPFEIEGDYILNSKENTNVPVTVEYRNKCVELEIDSDEEQINAFLNKDEATLLKSIQSSLHCDSFKEEPAFIVGPPGTGKTKVIIKLVEEMTKLDNKILILSHTNTAVENVFERLDTNILGISNDDIILTIKTEKDALKSFMLENVRNRKIQPIKDEIEILEMTKEELLNTRKEKQPFLEMHKRSKESINTILLNNKKELSMLERKRKSLTIKIDNCERRSNTLSSNAFIKSVAEIFMSKKLEEIKKEKLELEKEFIEFSNKIGVINKKITTTEDEDEKIQGKHSEVQKEVYEVNSAIVLISNKLKQLHKEENEIYSNNIYDKAKIVGATLVNAALNQKIQLGEFDRIIVDEVSMAIIPFLLAATQSLNNKKIENVKYDFDEELYYAQNKAVEMALNKKIIFVGDPKQLQPIAKTYEMKQSVFNLYEVDEVFNQKEVKNTIFLNINFRNHPHITKIASMLFYGGMLKSGKTDDGSASLYIKKSTSKMVSSQRSFVNYGNMKIVVSQIELALKRGRRDIGVITPYRKQSMLIEENLKYIKNEYSDADIQVGTVNTFQGREKDIIIFDLTFSPNKKNNYIPATYKGGLNSNTAKLLNVAMTRAESFFIVVGDVDGILDIKDSLILKDWLKEIISI